MATVKYILTDTDWQDLGVGPLKIQVIAAFKAVLITASVTTPADDTVAESILTDESYSTTDHLWAKAVNGPATIVTTPILS